MFDKQNTSNIYRNASSKGPNKSPLRMNALSRHRISDNPADTTGRKNMKNIILFNAAL